MVAVPENELDRRIAQYDRDVQELQGQVKLLEDELALTRRKLDAAPRQIHVLEKRLAETGAGSTRPRSSEAGACGSAG